MADVMEHVAYLSQEIGPRPAGTEEEQQAALYITEHMQKEAGLPAVIEDFTGISNNEIPRAICGGVTLLFTLLAVALPAVMLPAAIIAIVSAALYIAEAFDRPVLSKLFSRGVSQNVVAKYEPGVSPESGRSRRRKVILVAHYDSGKARPELNGPVVAALPIVKWAVLGGFAVAALVLLLSATVFVNVSGAVRVVLNVIAIIAAVLAALPLVQFVLHKTASYNDGANCNASGVAVLMDVASRVGRGRTDMSAFGSETEEPVIHGEEAAREEGLIPEGAEISYEAKPQPAAPAENEGTPASRLAAAKAAVAALSGKPVSDFMSEEILNASIEVKMPSPAQAESAPIEAASSSMQDGSAQSEQKPESSVAAIDPQPAFSPVSTFAAQEELPQQKGGVPAWFVEAQKKAKRPTIEGKPVQRSRYAEALDSAMTASNAHFAEANTVVINNAEQRIASITDGIMEIPAPEDAWQQAHPVADASSAEGLSTPRVVEMPVEESDIRTVENSVQNIPTTPVVQEIPSQPFELAVNDSQRPASTVQSILPEDLSIPDFSNEQEPALPSFLMQQPAVGSQAAQEVPSVEGGGAEAGQMLAETPVELQDEEPSAGDPSQTIPSAPVFVDTVMEATDQDACRVEEPMATAAPIQTRQPITLPVVEQENVVSLDSLKQRAPLAEAYNPEEERASKLRSALPSIDPARPTSHRPSSAQLRSALPSFSGILPKVAEEDSGKEESSAVSLTGSFAPVGATSSFAPIGDELLEDVDPEEIYVDDADDSAFDDPQGDAGQFATPGYVEMPKSRVRRLLDRFHRKPKVEEPTPQEWLDVDESFDARSVGAARGGWESFRNEDSPAPREQSAAYADAYADDSFEDYDDSYDDYEEFGYEDEEPRRQRPWQGGAFSRVRVGRVDMRSGKEDEPPIEGEEPPSPEPEAPEMQKIYQFRNPDIDTEVWFVALGAELDGHSGLQAFMAEHQHELRGAIVIELEALGAGDLCMIDQEGGYRVAKVSSRMKRYTRKATQATGVSVDSASMLWKSSTSSYATTHGMQAMHLVGMEDGKPASFGARDDSADNVDASLLKERAEYVMQLLKSI